MGTIRPWCIAALLVAGGCHAILPLATRGDEAPGDAGAPSDDLNANVCTPALEGKCHPTSGQVCLGGAWATLDCDDPTNTGCGEPHGVSSQGYCDPNWFDCVSRQPGFVESCDDYCDKVKGMKCCDSKKTDCAPHERCVTSRGYHRPPGADAGVNWGAESWYNAAECNDPLKLGVGQHYCDAVGNLWNDTDSYRCCCFPK